ncbi:hypothetical protein SBP02_11835 [Pseudomonas benzenivorans]|uniref:Uncharacterized protein n=1 Tax=Pseudomonas benzenivorans TaxID=556533 RepID=A0ABZ0PRE3_9PSED|nr:hypothetical protein [Pseudomonas benzenivorans]WPC03475.1 hypothetical protein SBP02_11835 [Pseudomonas benzenivorans]
MNNKTPSQLDDFTGDKSMYLHVQKPGKSERISIDYLTKDAIKTGDIALKITGDYPDYLKCDGLHYETSAHSDIANKLNGPGFGSIITNLNLNSENRFGDFKFKDVKRLGSVVVAISEIGDVSIYRNGLLVPHFIMMASKIFKGKFGIYIETIFGELYSIGASELIVQRQSNGKIVGVVHSESVGLDIIFTKDGTTIYADTVAEDDTNAVSFGSVTVDINSDFKVISGAGYVYVKMTSSESEGIYQIVIYPDHFDTIFIKSVTAAAWSIFAGASSYYMYEDGVLKSSEWGNFDFLAFPNPAISITDIVYVDNFLCIKQDPGTPFLFSFDAGSTWSDSPVMTSYAAIDADKKGVVLAGDYGSTGSIYNKSGSIQENSFTYVSDVLFNTPKIDSKYEYFDYYIKR